MQASYIENGVKYDVMGLLNTARHLPEKTALKKGLIAAFYDLGGPNLSGEEKWIVTHMAPLFREADAAGQLAILTAVLAI
jgi:hypothetical protein